MSSLQTLRAAGANVRWYCSDLDIAEAVLLASGPPGRLELSFADPLQVDYRDFIAVVAGAGSSLDRAIAASRLQPRRSDQCRRSAGALDLRAADCRRLARRPPAQGPGTGGRRMTSPRAEAQDHRPGGRHRQSPRRWRCDLPTPPAAGRPGRCRGGETAAAAGELLRGAIDDDIGAVGLRRLGQGRWRRTVRPANLREAIRHAGPTIALPASFGI